MEIVVSAAFSDRAGFNGQGEVVLLDGATGALIRRLSDPEGGYYDNLGWSVAIAPDMSGDGTSDIIAGVPRDDSPQHSDVGSVVVFDTATGAVLRKLQDSQGADYDELGFTAVAIGDLDGDGEVDIVTGARSGDRPKRPDLGRVVVFLADGDCDGDGVPRSGNDCDDADPTVRPGQSDSCDSRDDDCDGLVDEDGDGDGFSVCDECADSDAARGPDSTELCNALDDDCDILFDEGDDLDGDGISSPCDCRDTDPGGTSRGG